MWEDPKKGQPRSRVILESLAWASMTFVSVLSPEKALLVGLTLSCLLLIVSQQLQLQHLLPSPSCCKERGEPHWGQCLVYGKAAFCLFVDGQVQCVPSRDIGAGDTPEPVAHVCAL